MNQHSRKPRQQDDLVHIFMSCTFIHPLLRDAEYAFFKRGRLTERRFAWIMRQAIVRVRESARWN